MNEEIHKADLIATAYDLPHPPSPPSKLDGERCVIGGQLLTEGYLVTDVVSTTASDFWVFGGLHGGYMSVSAARCFLASNPKKCMICSKSMAVFGETGYEPLINDVAAKEQGRPWWAQLARDAWQKHAGEPCVVVLTTDAKTRIWHQPHVRAGVLGRATPVTVYDPGWPINTTISIDWPEMLIDLEAVEEIVSAGYWNSTLKTNLFVQRKGVEHIATSQVWEWERKLQTIRAKNYWPFIQLIARRLEE